MSNGASHIPAIQHAGRLLLCMSCLLPLLLASVLFTNYHEAGAANARAQNVTATPSRNNIQPAASSPTPKGGIPNIPRQHNYGLIAGGVIILVVILFGLVRYARKP